MRLHYFMTASCALTSFWLHNCFPLIFLLLHSLPQLLFYLTVFYVPFWINANNLGGKLRYKRTKMDLQEKKLFLSTKLISTGRIRTWHTGFKYQQILFVFQISTLTYIHLEWKPRRVIDFFQVKSFFNLFNGIALIHQLEKYVKEVNSTHNCSAVCKYESWILCMQYLSHLLKMFSTT